MSLTPEESQRILSQKLEILKGKNIEPEQHFIQNLRISLDTSPVVEDINHDRPREAAFQKSTIEGVYKARAIMDQLHINYIKKKVDEEQPKEEEYDEIKSNDEKEASD